jgi:Uma2 family endonuclease
MLALDLPHARPRRITRDEYHRLAEMGLFRDDERVELIHGTLVEMAPIGPPHANIVDVLNELLVLKLSGRAKVRIQQPLLGWDESEPEPDVAVVPARSYAERHPDEAFLVIEVAESSSLDYDRATKAPLYARSNVHEYWIVDVIGRAVIVHQEATAEGYARVTRIAEEGILAPALFPDVQVSIASLFV